MNKLFTIVTIVAAALIAFAVLATVVESQPSGWLSYLLQDPQGTVRFRALDQWGFPVMLGFGHDIFSSLWFFGGAKEANNDYDGPGMNHLGMLVQQQSEVDQMVEYLQERDIPCLFGTPRHRPEFSLDAEHTYYQVMFESPDHILFEVVYMGPFAK